MSDALFSISDVTGHILPAGDFDGDGVVDLAVDRGNEWSRVELVSTRKRRSLRTLATLTKRRGYGDWVIRTRAWDVGGSLDGDGVPDLLVVRHTGPHSRGVVGVAGSTGDVLWSRMLGDVPKGDLAACFVDDIDGDGVTDYALGLTKERLDFRTLESGSLSLHSGRSGAKLWSIDGHGFGTRVVSVPDLDGDGRRDLIAQPARESSTPILVCSSKDGRLLLGLENLHGDVTPAGDVTGDGTCDLFREELDGVHRGRVQVLDGKTGVLLFALRYPDFMSEYAFPAAMGDLDGDGFDDLAVSDSDFNLHGLWGSLTRGQMSDAVDLDELTLTEAVALRSQNWRDMHHSGCVIVYSGRTREPLMGVWGDPGTMRGMGLGIASLPDVSGDGWPDLLVADEDKAYVFAGPGSARIGGR